MQIPQHGCVNADWDVNQLVRIRHTPVAGAPCSARRNPKKMKYITQTPPGMPIETSLPNGHPWYLGSTNLRHASSRRSVRSRKLPAHLLLNDTNLLLQIADVIALDQRRIDRRQHAFCVRLQVTQLRRAVFG